MWQTKHRPLAFTTSFQKTKQLDQVSPREASVAPYCPRSSPHLSWPVRTDILCSYTFSGLPLTPDTLGRWTPCHSSWDQLFPLPGPLLARSPDLAVPSSSPARATPVGLWPVAFCALHISAITPLLTPSSDCPRLVRPLINNKPSKGGESKAACVAYLWIPSTCTVRGLEDLQKS